MEPGTTYHYRVGADGHWSADATFTTAPAVGQAAPFRFALAGGLPRGLSHLGLILDAIEPHAPDFYLFSGDAVNLGGSMPEWDAWFDAGLGHLDHRPPAFAHGNHEFQAQNYYALVAQPGNEQWFSFDYADAHFVVLNDTVGAPGDRDVQAAWMQADSAATDATWKFRAAPHVRVLLVHHPWLRAKPAGFLVANRGVRWGRPGLRGQLTITSGPTPCRPACRPCPACTTYIVAGGAGAVLYENDLANAFTAVAAVTEHFVIVDVAAGTLTLTAYDLAGNVLDTFVTTR